MRCVACAVYDARARPRAARRSAPSTLDCEAGEFQLSSNHGWIEVDGYGRAACQGATRILRMRFGSSHRRRRARDAKPARRSVDSGRLSGAKARWPSSRFSVVDPHGHRPADVDRARPVADAGRLATARGAYAELSLSRSQRSSVRRSRFTRTPSPVRTTNTRLSSGSARPASSTTRSPSQIAGAIESPATRAHIRRSGAPMRAAPTAPRTPPSPWSRPIRGSSDSAANRTLAANGTITASVSPSTDAPAGVSRG